MILTCSLRETFSAEILSSLPLKPLSWSCFLRRHFKALLRFCRRRLSFFERLEVAMRFSIEVSFRWVESSEAYPPLPASEKSDMLSRLSCSSSFRFAAVDLRFDEALPLWESFGFPTSSDGTLLLESSLHSWPKTLRPFSEQIVLSFRRTLLASEPTILKSYGDKPSLICWLVGRFKLCWL